MGNTHTRTILGIAALLIGLYGVWASALSFVSYDMFDEVLQASESSDNPRLRDSVQAQGAVLESLPPWWRSWTKIRALVSAPLSVAYIVSGGMLVTGRLFGRKLLFWVAGLAIAWSLTRVTVGAMAGGWSVFSVIQGQIAALVVHAVMMFFSSDRAESVGAGSGAA